MPYKDYKGKGIAIDNNSEYSEHSDSSTDSVINRVKQASLQEYLARNRRGNITDSLFNSEGVIASSSTNPVWISSDMNEIISIAKSKTSKDAIIK